MEFTQDPFGLQTENMDVFQMCLRGVVVFFSTLILLRIAGLRTMGKQSVFDHLTLLTAGAIMGRIVVTGKNFFGALAAVLVIVLLHRIIALLTFKSKKIGLIFKGEALGLILNGQLQQKNLSKAHITAEDLQEALHKSLNTENLDDVKDAYLERSGEISFVKRKEAK